MRIHQPSFCYPVFFLLALSCQVKPSQDQLKAELSSIDLLRGDITLCGADDRFGKVEFGLSCAERVRADFNLATALLHSFEYPEAEKMFVKVIDEDPECLMAYWGVAMSNFHPLWAPPTDEELIKGSKTIAVGRTIESKSKRESDYLEAVAVMFDDWRNLDHRTRLERFESAAERIYRENPTDREAAIFYALALRAASDPTDKTFTRQRKAGDILNSLFASEPNHPGIAHYLIHTYDYPELADLGLPAARKYADIAASSAHALHMPSHIFTRLGLWDESVSSNINSMTAAKCYAESSGINGHLDEELHGLDYLVYAYLQQGRDDVAKAQLDYLRTIRLVFPLNNKSGYTFAAAPARFALERKNWKDAAALQLYPEDFPWHQFHWERSIVTFARLLGAVRTNDLKSAKAALTELKESQQRLAYLNKAYEANQVNIQVRSSEAWISFLQGSKAEGIRLMAEAADMEDATDKHPVTPGEVIPARELLGDMLMEAGDFQKALEAYETDLKRHAGRFNGIYGAALAAKKLGLKNKAIQYFQELVLQARLSDQRRPELVEAKAFLKGNV